MANAYKLGDGGSQGKTFGFIGIIGYLIKTLLMKI